MSMLQIGILGVAGVLLALQFKSGNPNMASISVLSLVF